MKRLTRNLSRKERLKTACEPKQKALFKKKTHPKGSSTQSSNFPPPKKKKTPRQIHTNPSLNKSTIALARALGRVS